MHIPTCVPIGSSVAISDYINFYQKLVVFLDFSISKWKLGICVLICIPSDVKLR